MPDYYTDLFILLIFRGRAKPGKKAKLNKLVDDVNPSELEQQQPELSHPIAEDIIDDPPPQDHEVSTDPMDAEPAISKPPSPVKPTEEKTDDVVVTGFGFAAPGQPTVLSKHNAKEEISVEDKGKWKVDLESYTHSSAQDIHFGYLNRLYTSRDFEAGLVNLMKEHYEVNSATPFYMNILPLAAKFIGHDRITTAGCC